MTIESYLEGLKLDAQKNTNYSYNNMYPTKTVYEGPSEKEYSYPTEKYGRIETVKECPDDST